MSTKSPANRRRVPAKWIRNEADKRAIELGYWFDQDAVDFVIGFLEGILKNTTGRRKGKPFILEDWQRDFVSRLYGWMRPDGTRRFREAYLEIPKKNGKSTLFAALCLFSLIEEPGAEVYQGAVDSSQSAIIYREACRMIKDAPDLKRYFKPANKRFIMFSENEAFLEALTAEVEAKDGVNASATFLDEVHRYPRNSKIYDIFKFAGLAREQPILASLTTAGSRRDGICWTLHEEARKIDEGSTDNLRFLGVVYAASHDDDLDDPKVWKKANPSLGTILSEEDFAEEWAEAKRIPGRKANFLRLRFGIWTNDVNLWLDMELWDACANPAGIMRQGSKVWFNPKWWSGRRCNIGVDLSSVKDLCAITLTTKDGDVVQWHSAYFLPERTKEERSLRDGVPYSEWVRDGWIYETEGNGTDFAFIRRYINDLRDHGVIITTIGFDPWNAAQLEMELIQDGFNVVSIHQNMGNLTASSKELETRLLHKTLAHDGNPVTRWCASNASIYMDAMGNIMPSKTKSIEKIEGIASGVMSVGLTTARLSCVPGIVVV